MMNCFQVVLPVAPCAATPWTMTPAVSPAVTPAVKPAPVFLRSTLRRAKRTGLAGGKTAGADTTAGETDVSSKMPADPYMIFCTRERPKVGRCRLTVSKPHVESACGFSALIKLEYDEPLSNVPFKFNSRRYTKVTAGSPALTAGEVDEALALVGWSQVHRFKARAESAQGFSA